MAATIKRNNDDISGKVMELLELVRDDVENSKAMLDLGVSTRLVSQMEQFFADPLKAMLDSYGTLFKSIQSMMQEILSRFFIKNKDRIYKAFDASRETELVYYIVLNEDSFSNRDLFFNFLSEYDSLGFQSRIPLTIKFLPKAVLEKAQLQNEIALN